MPKVDHRALADGLALREAIDAGIRAVVEGRVFPADAARILNGWLANGPQRAARLVVSDGVAALDESGPADGVSRALHRIAVESAHLLGTDARRRLRICPGPNCGGRFVDASPAGRRRRCSMAICGNRAKVAKHRAGPSKGGSTQTR